MRCGCLDCKWIHLLGWPEPKRWTVISVGEDGEKLELSLAVGLSTGPATWDKLSGGVPQTVKHRVTVGPVAPFAAVCPRKHMFTQTRTRPFAAALILIAKSGH